MNIQLHFDGSTECRGRNGWFQLHQARIIAGPDLRGEEGYSVTVGLSSKVPGQLPPIYLNFTNPEELRQLICGLAKALHCMLALDPDPGTNPEEESV